MMHNGVLNWVDDRSDKTKSDTWHFIDQYIQPMLERAPDLFMVPAFAEMLGELIGNSNRLVFMDNLGQMQIVNQDTGIEHNGLWFSNTYAWSPDLLIPGYKGKTTKWVYSRHDEDDLVGYGTTTTSKESQTTIAQDIDEALEESDPQFLAECLRDYPVSSLKYLFENYAFDPYFDAATLSTDDAAVVQALAAGDQKKLYDMISKSMEARTNAAMAMCWYGQWVLLDQEDEDAPKCEFEIGKTYRTRDGDGLRKVTAIDFEEGRIDVVDTETDKKFVFTSTRWLDGRCLVKGNTGRDLVLPAIDPTQTSTDAVTLGHEPKAPDLGARMGALADALENAGLLEPSNETFAG
jgi:hypothetical protein